MTVETAKALYVALNNISVSGKENLMNLLACINTAEDEMQEAMERAKERGEKRGNNDNV